MKKIISILGFVAVVAACHQSNDVQCAEDPDCNLSAGGLCVPADTGNRWCAYPDSKCDSGYRYSENDVGDDLAGTCSGNGAVRTSILTVNVGGNGAGRVTSTPAGIDCPGTCSVSFPIDEQVTLTQAASSSVFLGWSDACAGNATCLVQLDANKKVGALFGVAGSNVWLSQLKATTALDLKKAKAFSNGDILIGGDFRDSIALGTTTLSPKGDGSAFIARLNVADGTTSWIKQLDAIKLFELGSLAIDAADNVYFSGTFTGQTGFSGSTLTPAGTDESFVAKADATTGAVVWAKVLNSSTSSKAVALATDPSGDVTAAGTFAGMVAPGTGTLNTAAAFAIYVLKLSTTGTVAWAKALQPETNKNIFLGGVAIDDSGNVAVAGGFRGSVDLGGGPITETSTEDGSFILKLASADGAHLFSKGYNLTGSNYCSVRAMTMDSGGAIYVTGEYGPGLTVGATTLQGAGTNGNVYVAKYSTAGAPTWLVGFGRQDTRDFSKAIEVAEAGKLLLSLQFEGSIVLGNDTLTSAGDIDAAVASVDAATGQAVKAVRFGGSGYDVANTVVKSKNNVFAAGTFTGFAEFGGQALNAQGSVSDGFLLMLMPLN